MSWCGAWVRLPPGVQGEHDLYCKKKQLFVLPGFNGFMEEGMHHICVYIG